MKSLDVWEERKDEHREIVRLNDYTTEFLPLSFYLSSCLKSPTINIFGVRLDGTYL